MRKQPIQKKKTQHTMKRMRGELEDKTPDYGG